MWFRWRWVLRCLHWLLPPQQAARTQPAAGRSLEAFPSPQPRLLLPADLPDLGSAPWLCSPGRLAAAGALHCSVISQWHGSTISDRSSLQLLLEPP